jgi:prolyl-tRNA editing enzyme YbaK/EbsC (Cys-tRNA(Pro) deacylase)
MSLDSVKRQFQEENFGLEVIEFEESSATVELAAQLLGVAPGRIAKTMAFHLKDRDILVLFKGDVRIDNQKFRACFGEKASLLKPEQVLEATGHPVGGVCPFGLKQPLQVYLDLSLQEFDYVYPAGGSHNSAVKISVSRLAEITGGNWVDVSKESEHQTPQSAVIG